MSTDAAIDALSTIIEEQTTDNEALRVALELQMARISHTEAERDRLFAVVSELADTDLDVLTGRIRDRVAKIFGDLSEEGAEIITMATLWTWEVVTESTLLALDVG